jgi:hypothetical protein
MAEVPRKKSTGPSRGLSNQRRSGVFSDLFGAPKNKTASLTGSSGWRRKSSNDAAYV